MYIITSYYTNNTPYKQVMNDYLLKSLKILGIDYHVEPIRDMGSHQKNANYKPKFILEEMNKYADKNIVFLDADAEVLQIPVLFDQLKCDIACHELNWSTWYNKPSNIKELLPGTLWVKNNDKMKQFIEEWADVSENNYKWDGHILQDLLKQDKSIDFVNLPLEYCYIKTMPNGSLPFIKIDKPFIVHNQVSRLYRKG